jgi:hypothetical protein
LRRQLGALEVATFSRNSAEPQPVTPIGPTDTEHIATRLSMEFEERTLAEKLELNVLLAEQRNARESLFSDEAAHRGRHSELELELRDGLRLMLLSEAAIQSQRVKRREYDEAKLLEVERWREQAQRMDSLDKQFHATDRKVVTAIMAYDEAERQKAEDMYRKRMAAERQLLFMDEDDFLSQQLILERLNLVRLVPR